MNSYTLARLGLALLGVLAAVQGLTVFPTVAAATTFLKVQLNAPAAIFTVVLPFTLVWVVSYYLVFRSERLALYLASRNEALSQTGPPQIHTVAVGLVGMLIIAYALPNLLTALGAMLIEGTKTRELTRLVVAHAAQALLGVVLVLRPDILVAFWALRNPGAETA